MKQSVKLSVAPELEADRELVEAIPQPGAHVRAATQVEQEEWLKAFRKECPEVFNRRTGLKLGPPERMD